MASPADIRDFELLVLTTLRPLVHRRHAELARARQTRAQVEQLQMQVDLLATHAADARFSVAATKPLKALVDVGAGYQMHARIPATDLVAVHVGCDVFLELSLDEARAYCGGRLTSLAQLISVLEAEVLKTATDLVIAENGLEELHRAEAEAGGGADSL